jgi:hypothetical protein
MRFCAIALLSLSVCRGRVEDRHAEAPVADAGIGIAIAKPCPDEMVLVPVNAGVCVDLYEGALVDAGTVRATPAHGIYPQSDISQVQARDACAGSGKRLCTRVEWTAACRGKPAHDYVYPYGDAYDSTACNEGRSELARGGDYPKCKSTYGAFDMHGNLHEWVDDSLRSSELGTFMGGFFVDAKVNGNGCEYATTAHAKTYRDYSTGFRCCANPILL